MTCVQCGSRDTKLYRGDDDRFRKECDACGHIGGPYVSGQGVDEGPSAGQATLSDW